MVFFCQVNFDYLLFFANIQRQTVRLLDLPVFLISLTISSFSSCDEMLAKRMPCAKQWWSALCQVVWKYCMVINHRIPKFWYGPKRKLIHYFSQMMASCSSYLCRHTLGSVIKWYLVVTVTVGEWPLIDTARINNSNKSKKISWYGMKIGHKQDQETKTKKVKSKNIYVSKYVWIPNDIQN